MRNQKLNSLVVSYRKTGDPEAFAEIYREISPWFEKASNEVFHFVSDVSKFEARLAMKLERAIREYDENSKLSFKSFAIRIINREKRFIISRNMHKPQRLSLEYLDEMSAEQGGFQLRDEAPPVETYIIVKEKVALLAQGDVRKATILRQWANGENDTEISKVLAHLFGGKAASHYRYISRFRKSLRESSELYKLA